MRRRARARLALLRGLRVAGGELSPRFPRSPERAARRSGLLIHRLVVLLVVLFVAGAWGCAPPTPDPPSDPELRAALGADGNTVIHRITLGGRGATEHVVPRNLDVEPGDWVQFAPVDRRVHTIVFEGDSLSAAAEDFLDRTGQRASPPLLDPASRFVVTFEGAPPGAYPFTSKGHGDPVRGVILVRDPASPQP